MKKRQLGWMAWSLVLIILIGCTVAKSKPAAALAYPIQVVEAIEKDVPILVDTIGNVYSLQTVQIRPQVGGIILEAYVKQGQYVKKGDPLYKIDPRPYQASLDRAKAALIKDKAALQLAQITVDRYAGLVQKDYVSKLNFDQYQANVISGQGQVESDEADIATAQLNIEWCTPVSPIDGKISQFNIDPGNLVVVNDSNALTDIRQITPADVRFSINQSDFIKVQQSLHEGHLKFEVILPQEPDKPREGHIYFIDNHIDLTTGSILLRGTVPNEDEFLWPGEFIRVRLQTRIQPHAVLIPAESIRIGQEGSFVYVYKPDTSTVEYRLIKQGETIDKLVIIEQGVKAGEQVVIKGQINLRPNAKVYLIQEGQKIEEKGL